MRRAPNRSLRLALTLVSALALAAAGCSSEVQLPSNDDDTGNNGDPDAGDAHTPPVDGSGPDAGPSLTCGPGTQLDPSGTMCVPVLESSEDLVTCPEGYMPAGSIGEAQVCVPVLPVTVHGFVTDAQTDESIEGVTVTLYPADGEEATTDANGYFRMDGVPYKGDVTMVYQVEDYYAGWMSLYLPLEGGDGLKVLLVDASVALEPLPTDGPVVPTDGDNWLAGTVYAGGGPAEDLSVHLYNNTLGEDVATVTTDGDGDFLISGVYDDDYSFSLRVGSYDVDGDGVYDYQYEEVYIGGLTTPSPGLNLSNIVIVLEPVQKNLAYVNFVPPLQGVSGPGVYTGLEFGNPTADLILHFGAETDPTTLDVRLVEWFDGTSGDQLTINPSWNNAGTVLTVNPALAFVADADNGTEYELRIQALLWADGSSFVPLDAGMAGALRLRFDVGDSPDYLPSPTPGVYLDNLMDADQMVSQMSCDSRVCWLVDPLGYPFGGNADTSTSGSSDAFFNGASGFQLSWQGIDGAASYTVYARQTFDTEPSGWQKVNAQISSGFAVPGDAPTIYATGVLSGGNPNWHDYGVGYAGGSVGNPLAYGNMIQLAVTATDEQGFEGAIDSNKTIGFIDTTQARVSKSSEVSGGASPQESTTELGFFGTKKIFDVTFSELLNTEVGGTWDIESGNITFHNQPSVTSWDVGGQVGSSGSDQGRFGPMTVDFRGVCTAVIGDAAGPSSTVSVQDVTLFLDGGEVFFLNASGSGMAHPTLMTLTFVDAGADILELTNTFEEAGGSGLSAGSFACANSPKQDLSTNITEPIESGQTELELADQRLFYPNQQIVVFSASPDPVVATATVIRVREPVFGGPGFLIQQAGIDVSPSLPFSRDNALVLARPTSSELGFRKAHDLVLDQTVTTDGSGILPLTTSSLESSMVLEGDLALVDVDGVWDTVADRYRVSIASVQMQLFDESKDILASEFHVEVGPAPGNAFALPSQVVLVAGQTRIVHLGDAFLLSGYQDTSGNGGLNEFADGFSYCDGSLPGCSNGIFVY